MTGDRSSPRSAAARALIGSGLTVALGLAACARPAATDPSATVPPAGRYVAMGSSFAAGPGIMPSADTPPNRCARARDNYAGQVARRRGFMLVDVSCSGATTAHVLGAWNELPPQIDAVTPDTRLVTVTIGGNDVSYVRNLIAYSCAPPPGKTASDPRCPTVNIPTATDWQALGRGLNGIAAEVRRRAPRARLIFVQYVPLLPTTTGCAQVPLKAEAIATLRTIASRLADETRAVAKRWGADVVDPASTAAPHDPCSGQPWATGFPENPKADFIPYHPNLAGMSAIARLIDATLSKGPLR